jgi:hypothetical protein
MTWKKRAVAVRVKENTKLNVSKLKRDPVN